MFTVNFIGRSVDTGGERERGSWNSRVNWLGGRVYMCTLVPESTGWGEESTGWERRVYRLGGAEFTGWGEESLQVGGEESTG